MRILTTKDISWQWIAGFFDGEGCVSMHFKKRGRRNSTSIQLTLSQKFPGVLGLIQKKCNEIEIHSNITPMNQRNTNCLRFCGKENLKRLLTKILPYSIVKKEQVELALEFLKLVNSSTGAKKVSNENHNKRKRFVQKVKQLKRKETVKLK